MPLAAASTSYPLLNIFWTMFEFFLWVVWVWVLIIVLMDVFRSHDLSGWAKALWVLFVAAVPVIGVLAYLIARGGQMHDRAERRALGRYEALGNHVQPSAAPGPADELVKLARLRDEGVITTDEFAREKAKVLA